jgi:hypothetical protein
MSDYKSFTGIVAFDITEREVTGKTVRNVPMKLTNSANDTIISVTLWPGLDSVEVNRGDFIVVEGKYKSAESNGKMYHNLSANSIAVFPMVKSEDDRGNGSPTPVVANPARKVEF